jgi:ABC-type branched-subunit amino acid transport system substrate-binding protein
VAELKTTPEVGDDPGAEEGLREAQRMMGPGGVNAIIGGDSSTMVLLPDVAEREQVPVISSYAGTVEIEPLTGEWLWRTVPGDSFQGNVVTKFFIDEEIPSAGILVENAASTLSIAETFKTGFEESGGEITADVTVDPGEPSYRSQVNEVVGTDPAFILCACTLESGASILQELANSGYDGGIYAPAELGTDEILQEIGPDVMEGAYSYTSGEDPDAPAFQRFTKDFKAANGHEAAPFSASAYDATNIAILAAMVANSTDGQAISDELVNVSAPPGEKVDSIASAIEALQNGEEIDYEGASGPVDISEDGQALASYAPIQARDGTWEAIGFYTVEDLAEIAELSSGN